MQIGLIGLQNSGKTTLFKTLAEGSSGVESNRAVVKVPDERLNKLTELFNPKKEVHATLEVVDIPGLQVGDDGKMKITSDFLNKVKNNDLLLHVVREFENDTVPHPENKIDPVADIEFLETEFLLADLTMVENRIEKLNKEILKNRSDNLLRELKIFETFKAHLEDEKPLRTLIIEENDLKLLSGYQFLSMKPMIIGINFSDGSKDEVPAILKKVSDRFPTFEKETVPFFAQFEMELAQLSEEEAEAFKEDLGITDSALTRILRTSYELLGLQSFFTVGEDECRAWTIKKGYTAQQSAGVIHTDFFNRFIRAEVVHYTDYITHGSFAKCKDAGVWRLEGKEYIVKDGDILNIRHS
ncbi:MAG: redox-regulated ATPase YchF [Ignavibacteriales bacterium]|nr:MAG: redox-regulated ATPase YchF [Ignavibacteriaceae bacterium]MBW7871842.1 redox-regulated ATPase YchF [Ignavibacteria bacterium]MCZ2144308.1 redox-regulated ATPase YchF [Ignavibacteriales bacterium]OQY75991.1 MAG: redox-regulated ATPase YchF [Ignavibacteriales bacterium UTCHB3]MBV6446261.1 Ribosome-binding ATPase YchF [Ignavibacteriaceae bacterium]